uniref:cytochrome c3 family protein n=1 Tax=uncultured Arthrobacter sp. TaxID=114050 RepID=UPI003216D2D7
RPAKYSQFDHSTKQHRADCASCHKFPSKNWNKVRTGDAAFPDITEYPSHNSCVKCHAQQFFRGARPMICSICHTAASPRGAPRHPFPNPREIFDRSAKGKTAVSDFAIRFPHETHIEIVSSIRSSRASFVNASFVTSDRRQASEQSCAVCHKTMEPQGDSDQEYLTKPPEKLGDAFWLKKGTFKSIPTSHATCFTCHSADSGMNPAPSSCATCHQLKQAQPAADMPGNARVMTGDNKMMVDLWARRNSTGVFRHEHFAHVELSCSTCHNVTAMNTADPASTRVQVASCATCHATATSDEGGALNYEADMKKKDAAFQCVKCHVVFGKSAIPESHLKAIAAAAGK